MSLSSVEEGREGRDDVPIHVAQTDPLSREKVLWEDVTIHVVQMGTLPLECLGEERDVGGE
jgi:hypothetical protein